MEWNLSEVLPIRKEKSVGTPHILLHSGIGPKNHLEEIGIPVIKELNGVGENLQDHLALWMPFHSNIKSVTKTDSQSISNILKYLLWKEGPLATSAIEVIAFMDTGLRKDLNGAPDIQIFFVSGCATDELGDIFGWDSSKVDYLKYPKDGFTVSPVLLHPKSTGYVKLRSLDPLEHPIIEPNYFHHEDDIKTFVKAMNICLSFGASDYLRKEVNSTPIYHHKNDFAPNHDVNSVEYLEWWARSFASTVYHPVGTCKMGKEEDQTSVVNSKLQVKGIKNLRIADASIMPELISGNTNAPTIMIGEKAADIIKQAHKLN